ncbi:hypothetical protein [Azospirillum rugosum]|uniref:Terminase small subunit n=1 Tax=Azospirillum rugosum TaxID=416170 RepID=A0ABS4SDS4_9PROT|nr:hypothetical protein [Azospirillum rugosum]MBP2290730.1 hypothetical protein [Azospirillum rugosum]MDQ0525619.1 hypothetical protein [Azospirillum rugosum]
MTDATPQPDRIDLPDHAAPKRPRVWTPERRAEAWERLLQHITDGGSLDAFCALPDTPSKPTVYEWIRGDASLANEYARAREMQGDSYADQVADAAKKVLDGKLDAQAGRTAIDALKWLAAKRKPKVYGDRIDVNANVNANVAVGWVIDLSAPADVTPVLDGTAVRADQPAIGQDGTPDVVAE